ncbi:hypothetical protein JCM30760_17230 [Thiomicrorhabdus hydrogeniphila]
MHKLLSRQLKKAYGNDYAIESLPSEVQTLITLVTKAYDDLSDERKFLEYTLEMNSAELTAANDLVTEKNKSLNKQIRAANHSKVFLKRLIDSIPMFVLTLDKELNIITSNEQFLANTNKKVSSFKDIFPDSKTLESFNKDVQFLFSEQSEYIYHEMELFDNYNNTLYISWTHTLVENESGEAIILSIGSDLTHRKEAENAMQWMAYNDSLTHIGNRRDFQKNIKVALQRKTTGALAFIDVNHFKQINDFHGHTVGDQVLIHIADTLKQITRSIDIVSRLAGDEFTVFFCRVDETNINHILDKLAKSLNSYITLQDGSRLEYSVSIGAALFPLHSQQEEELIIKADIAMYKAKKSGVGRWHLFDPVHDDLKDLKEDNRLIYGLKQAIESSRMQLYYQPILCLETKTVSHYEVLLRMIDENGKMVFPGEFIPAAERMGLIRNIDEWVLGHALQQLALNLKTYPNLKFTVNISAPSLQAAEFPNHIKQALQESGVASKHLIIELTETAYIDNVDQVKRNLQKIHALGVKIALDDFGVGFSSFSYLKKMPLSYVKLDGSYVKELINSPEDQVFVEGVSKMVQAYGMQTIAEFVGDDATCKRLMELGVSYGQGYFIGQPKPYLATIDEIKTNLLN